jgi:hypothetical protein
MPSRSNRETPLYGAPTGASPVNPQRPREGRPVVGEADPATRRRMLDQRLSEREPVRPRAARTAQQSDASGVSPNAARLLRDRGKQIDREVDKYSK